MGNLSLEEEKKMIAAAEQAKDAALALEVNQVRLEFGPKKEDMGLPLLKKDGQSVRLSSEDFKPASFSGIASRGTVSPELDFEKNMRSTRNTANDAYEVQVGFQYSTVIQDDGNAWFVINTDGMAGNKISIASSFAGAVNYYTIIYKLDPATMIISEIVRVTNIFATNDAVAFIAEGGYYYFRFVYIEGDKNLTFNLEAVENPGGMEPNDNVYQAYKYTDRYGLWDYVDGMQDVDWTILKATKTGRYYISIAFSDNTKVPFLLYIVNSGTGEISFLSGDTPLAGAYFTVNQPGEYGICVMLSSAARGKNYLIQVGQSGSPNGPTHIEMKSLEGGTECEYVNSIGIWRLVGNKVGGKLKITCEAQGGYGSELITATVFGRKDDAGRQEICSSTAFVRVPNFEISVGCPMSTGKDGSWDSGYLTHYYDFNYVSFYDFAMNPIDSNLIYFMNVRN